MSPLDSHDSINPFGALSWTVFPVFPVFPSSGCGRSLPGWLFFFVSDWLYPSPAPSLCCRFNTKNKHIFGDEGSCSLESYTPEN